MLKKIEVPNENIIAFEVTQKLTKDDYIKTLEPLARSARDSKRKLKLLLKFGEEFNGFTSGAVLEDFKLGTKNMKTFERIAIVSDNKWISKSSSFIGSFIPTSLKTYKNKSLPLAINWLTRGEKGIYHSIDMKRGILVAKVKTSLTSDLLTAMAREVDAWIEKNGELKGIVIQAKKFPGWRDIGSLISHIQFVKNHHKKVGRVAFCADDRLTELIPKMAEHFIKAEVRHFQFNELEVAKEWASHGHVKD